MKNYYNLNATDVGAAGGPFPLPGKARGRARDSALQGRAHADQSVLGPQGRGDKECETEARHFESAAGGEGFSEHAGRHRHSLHALVRPGGGFQLHRPRGNGLQHRLKGGIVRWKTIA